MTRIYLPATLADLAAYDASGTIPASVERLVADDESEEAEYAALVAAAEDAYALLDGTPGRRVVLVADVADVDAEVALRELVAVHADTEDGADPDEDLGWFGVQEIPDLLGRPAAG